MSLFLLTLALVAPPRVAIVELPPIEAGKGSSAFLANPLAQALELRGAVSPVVLSLSDPVFREAANAGRVSVPEVWDRKKALAAAAAIRADYLMEVRTGRYGDLLRADLTLLRGGRQVWKDTQRVSSNVGGRADDAGAAANAIRNWIPLLEGGPLKGYAPVTLSPVAADPVPVSTQPPVTAPPPPAPDDDEALNRQIDRWIAEDKLGRAIGVARDGVDRSPLSSSRRRTLIRLLSRSGDHHTAAGEARRSGILLPDRPIFLVDAAREWMALGELDEAKRDLNEALARGVGAEAQSLVAEIELLRGRPEVALRAADEAMRAGPSPDALFSRALARALLGGADGVRDDLKTLAGLKVDDAVRAGRHARAIAILDPAAKRAGDEIRSLITRAAVKREDPAVLDATDDLARRISARIALLEGVPPSVAETEKAAKRLLAHRLYAQSLEEVRAWIKEGDADALRDARIDLGEALRSLKELSAPAPEG